MFLSTRMSKICQKQGTLARLSRRGVGTGSLGLTALRGGTPAVAFSRCGNKWVVLGLSVWKRGECGSVLLDFATGSEMRANVSVPGFCLPPTGCALGDASTHLSHLHRGLSGRAVRHEDLLLQCRHPGRHERLDQGHEPGCAGAVSVVTEEVSPSGRSLGECFLP